MQLPPGLKEDLAAVDRDDLDILNSRNHRAMDEQYIHDLEVDAETESQHHELRGELDRRQAIREELTNDSSEATVREA